MEVQHLQKKIISPPIFIDKLYTISSDVCITLLPSSF